MPFYTRSGVPSVAGGMCEEERENGEGNGDPVVFSHSIALNLEMSLNLIQLSSLTKRADDMFNELMTEHDGITKRIQGITERCGHLESQVRRLNHKTVKIPESDLSEFHRNERRDLYYNSERDDEARAALFTSASRPAGVRSSYEECKKEDELSEECYRRYQEEAEHLLSLDRPDKASSLEDKVPNIELETRKPADVARVVDVDVSEQSRSRASQRRRRRCHSEDMLSNSGDTDVADGEPLPTPAEAVRRTLHDSSLIPVDTSGVPFTRICQYRQSLRSASLDSLDVRSPKPKGIDDSFMVTSSGPVPIQRSRTLEFEQCRSSGYKTDDDSDLDFRISRSHDGLDSDFIGNYEVFEKNPSSTALSRLRGSFKNLSCLANREDRARERDRSEMKYKSRSMPNVAAKVEKQKSGDVAVAETATVTVAPSIETLNSGQTSCFNKLRRSRSVAGKRRDSGTGLQPMQRSKSQDIARFDAPLAVVDIVSDQDEGIAVSRDDVSQSGTNKKEKRKSLTRRLSQLWTNVQFRGFKVTRKPERQSSSGHWTASSGDFRQSSSSGSGHSPDRTSFKDSAVDLICVPERMSLAGSLADSVTDLRSGNVVDTVTRPPPLGASLSPQQPPPRQSHVTATLTRDTLTRHNLTVASVHHHPQHQQHRQDEDVSSTYSMDADGFYTSMHTDSGLKRSSADLSGDEEFARCIFNSSDSVNSVIHRLSVIKLDKPVTSAEKQADMRSKTACVKVEVHRVPQFKPPPPPRKPAHGVGAVRRNAQCVGAEDAKTTTKRRSTGSTSTNSGSSSSGNGGGGGTGSGNGSGGSSSSVDCGGGGVQRIWRADSNASSVSSGKLTVDSSDSESIYQRLKLKTNINASKYPGLCQITDISDAESYAESDTDVEPCFLNQMNASVFSTRLSAIPSPWTQFASPYSTIDRYKTVMTQEQRYDGTTEFRVSTPHKIAFKEFAVKKMDETEHIFSEKKDATGPYNSWPRSPTSDASDCRYDSAPTVPPKPAFLTANRDQRPVRLNSVSSDTSKTESTTSSTAPCSSLDCTPTGSSLSLVSTGSCSTLTPTQSPDSTRKTKMVRSTSLTDPTTVVKVREPVFAKSDETSRADSEPAAYANFSVSRFPDSRIRSPIYSNTNIYANCASKDSPEDVKFETENTPRPELIYAITDVVSKAAETDKAQSKGFVTGIRVAKPDYAALPRSRSSDANTSSDDGTLTDRSGSTDSELNIPESMRLLNTFDHTLNAAKLNNAKNRNRAMLCSPVGTDCDEPVNTSFATSDTESVSSFFGDDPPRRKSQTTARIVSTPRRPFRPSLDRPSLDRPNHDRPSHDRPSLDRHSHDRPSHDRPSHDRPSLDRPSLDRPSLDRPSHDRPDARSSTATGHVAPARYATVNKRRSECRTTEPAPLIKQTEALIGELRRGSLPLAPTAVSTLTADKNPLDKRDVPRGKENNPVELRTGHPRPAKYATHSLPRSFARNPEEGPAKFCPSPPKRSATLDNKKVCTDGSQFDFTKTLSPKSKRGSHVGSPELSPGAGNGALCLAPLADFGEFAKRKRASRPASNVSGGDVGDVASANDHSRDTSDDVNETDVMEILDSIRTTIKGMQPCESPDSGTSSMPTTPLSPGATLTLSKKASSTFV